MDRRTALGIMSGAIAAAATRTAADERERTLQSNSTKPRLRKIATEEAFIIPEIASAVRDVVRRGGSNLDLKLLRLIGIDNVMWAIDYPYQPTAPAVAFLESAKLSTADLERIAHGNAERIFGIRA